VADVIQIRRDTASNWTSTNPTLASGELGFETDTEKLKLGDGSTAWTSLSYYTLATLGYAPLAGATFTGVLNATGGLQLSGTSITADATELNVLDGIPAGLTTTELGYVDGVTSSIQTQLDTKGTVSDLSDLSITSTAAELNKLDALSRGSILYGNASGATTVLTKGTANQLLTSDGTDIAWQNAGAATVEVTDSTANTNFPIVFHNESNLLFDDTGALRYNPSTGELLVPKLTVAGTTTTADTVTMNAANAVVFEGATADAYETTLSIMDPTADHTQYLINQGGYIPVLAASTTTAITSTPAELNILDGVTADKDELNILDGVTATAGELNILDGVTANKDELNVLDGIPAGLTATELGYVDGVTSSIQTQITDHHNAATPHIYLGTPTTGNLSNCTVDGTNGVGFKNVPQNSQSAAYTCVLADSGKHIHHPSTDANARTYTIPANSSVAYPTGTAITFTNMTAQVVTIAITSDTLYLAKDGTTGSRLLAQWGMATALKVDATKWLISGNGLT